MFFVEHISITDRNIRKIMIRSTPEASPASGTFLVRNLLPFGDLEGLAIEIAKRKDVK